MGLWPYGESRLPYVPCGAEVAVFHGAIKKMSEYGVDDGFADKVQACA